MFGYLFFLEHCKKNNVMFLYFKLIESLVIYQALMNSFHDLIINTEIETKSYLVKDLNSKDIF